MKVIVHGLGALGGNFGGRLLEVGVDVSFFVRERRANQIKQEGLKIFSPEGDFEAPNVNTITNVEDVKDADLIILAVKGYHLKEAIPQVKQMVEQTNAFVLPLLNGMEHISILQEAVGKEKVMGGFANVIATLNEKGHVIHSSKRSFMSFGPLHKDQEEICAKLAQLNDKVKTNLKREEDILKSMWKKYMFIAAFSGITSAMQLPSGYIAANDATYKVAKNVVNEMGNLAQREGVNISQEDIEEETKRLTVFPKEATSSMHQDMRKGLPLEVEHLHGGALRLAEKHHLSMPVVETIYGILKPYENGKPE